MIVTIRDDGAGGADPAAGSGLRGLDDRLAAFGGSLSIISPMGGGTTIRAELPLETASAATIADTGAIDSAALASAAFAEMGRSRLAGRLPDRGSPPCVPSPRRRPGSAATRGSTRPTPSGRCLRSSACSSRSPRRGGHRRERHASRRGARRSFARPFVYQVRRQRHPALSRPARCGRYCDLQTPPCPRGAGRRRGHLDLGRRGRPRGSCRDDSRLSPLEPGPDALLTYLRSIDRLIVGEAAPVTIDARPATRVDLTVAGQASGCPIRRSHLWRESDGGGAIAIADHERVRLIIVDVDEATIVFEIWSQIDVGAWQPTAEAIVGSVRFLHRSPGETTSTASPVKP